MVQRIGGKRRKTRSKMTRSVKEKGRVPIKKYFQKFNEGDQVQLKAEPSVQNGVYHLDFHGKTGSISGMQGECYHVSIKDGGKAKKLIVHPVHLKKL